MELPTCPPCPLCQGASRPAYMAAEYRMYSCRACGTAFVSPLPSPEQLAAFYQRFHLPSSAGGFYETAERRALLDIPAKIDWMKRNGVRSGHSVLDVGCGRGFFIRACQQAGLAARGIELSASAVTFAVDNLGVDAVCGTIEDLAPTLSAVDHVTLWATIEHVRAPASTLRTIYSLLKPGGSLFLDTGVAHDWLDSLLPGSVQWYDPPQHLWVFSIAGLRRLLVSAGFDVLEIDPCFERTRFRRAARILRGLAAATSLRLVAGLLRLHALETPFTRFPLGNLMAIRGQKPLTPHP